jgi:hypothetical protein
MGKQTGDAHPTAQSIRLISTSHFDEQNLFNQTTLAVPFNDLDYKQQLPSALTPRY